MKLFESKNGYEPLQNCSSYVATPLGRITFDININQNLLSEIPVERNCFRLSKGGSLASYSHSDFLAELVLCKPIVRIPSYMNVEKAYGAVWRVQSFVDNLSCDFLTALNPVNTLEIDSGPDSGEGLEAITWDYREYRLTLGTQDGTLLVHRSKINDMMPNRLNAEDEIAQHNIVQYIQNGLVVPLPPLLKNEMCQVHFVIAWNKYEDSDDVSPWFAVDMDGKSILSKEGLY
ncbi:hypothetical protein QUF99_03325 [Bacillus sp. DX4.1]|uniref:hypothetical protein n=1 Tax=Bacillus sp. DX4.1 TaxID=3055867 RepID=UPI00259FE37C|nr:hypothetical protein [Bacillus sp. DX4.1]MDM5186471.1 hypothetical protein [Bacillus sp. DX4.1]